uniref:F-box domain-containing protein n=1 Tax=Bionectria ochroleuca TaxID=29856 RepID=A0A8H7N6U9_BIOOC
MDPAPYLSTLPAEILQLIIEHTHPSGHWPLAQTCRYLYQNSERVLNLHRDAYRKLRVTSGLDPMSVFNLLWSVFSHGVAHIDAWHVREFEVSEADSNPDEALLDERSEALPWSPPEFDIEYFCENLLKIPDFFPKTNDGPWGDDVRYGLETGRESITKSLMLVHLPRIRAIRCAKAGRERHPWVEMLCEYIYWCKAAETWLPGLETLEKFAALLCLPNLSEVYFAHLDGDFELSDLGVDLFTNGPQAPFDKTSPVRTIILDHLENRLSKKLISFLAKMPRALQNIAIRFEVIYDHEERSRSAAPLVEALSEHQCKSLQRVCFDADRMPDWPFFMPGLNLDVIRLFDDLRVVNLDWPAVEMSLAESDERLPREELLDRLFRLFQLCLPDKMEILVLDLFEETVGVLLTGELARGNRDNLGYIDEAIEAAIKSRRYDNLKAVMLGYIQVSLHYAVGGDWHFPKAVKAAEERGIYIGLKGDMPPPGLGLDGTFVPVPTRSCMATGRLRTEEE